VGDETRSNFLGELTHQSEIVSSEVLGAFLVRYLEDSNSVITQFDRNKHYVFDDLV